MRPSGAASGVRVCAEAGHKDELDWADRWQNPTLPWPLRWDKRTGVDHVQV
jgi:hypothetical protein